VGANGLSLAGRLWVAAIRCHFQVPFCVDLLKAPQQEAPQATGCLDLAVQRLHDRHVLGVNPGTLRYHCGQGPGADADALQHRHQVLHIRRLVAHDHLVVAVNSHRAVLALQIAPA
jgi:hypothetical protein